MQSDLDLASLLASRLCHDVVGPVGAIQNGLELLAEDESMADMAMDLIKKSAAQASSKLQYARMAYGTSGGSDVLDPGEAGRLTREVFGGERSTLEWNWSGDAQPRDAVKIAMLMATYALGAVPRGGTITLHHEAPLAVEARGEQVRTPPYLEIVTGGGDIADPRAVQALCINKLAAAMGRSLVADEGADAFKLSLA